MRRSLLSAKMNQKGFVKGLMILVGLIFVGTSVFYFIKQSQQSPTTTALQTLQIATPELKSKQPKGVVEGLLESGNTWTITVWDPDQQKDFNYRIDSSGLLHEISNTTGSHEVVTVINLANGILPNVIDSNQALDDANQAGGTIFQTQTHIGLYSMQLTAQDGDLVWIIQYGFSGIIEHNCDGKHLKIILDAKTGKTLSKGAC